MRDRPRHPVARGRRITHPAGKRLQPPLGAAVRQTEYVERSRASNLRRLGAPKPKFVMCPCAQLISRAALVYFLGNDPSWIAKKPMFQPQNVDI